MRAHFHIHGLIDSPDEKPKITGQLLKRVLQYALPYRWLIGGILLLILTHTGMALLNPLIFRDLLDRTIPNGDLHRLIWLALALLFIPAFNGLLNVIQRRLNARVGEGVIYDLRRMLYANLQRMSLRFFTNTRVGELMSRLNNDVIGAQNAISNTIVSIVTQFIQAVAVLVVMLTLEWRLTLIAVAILPLFILAARRLGNRLRELARRQMEANAQMNAMMNETLNIGGALLVKLFGRQEVEVGRFSDRAAQVRDLGVQRAFTGSIFGAIVGLISGVGAALVYGLGGYFAIKGPFSVGDIVAFVAYLGSLYGALQGLSNAPVEFATSMVSFERVFEVIDLPVELPEKAEAVALSDCQGEIVFDQVSFKYEAGDENLLSDVRRYGSMDSVVAVLSGSRAGAGDRAGNGEEEIEPRSQARSVALEEISFRAAPGQLVALVGPSGAGKTTLTYLIPRLYDPSAGGIRIDGYDLRELTLESLSAQIGMVTQETYLFHDTVRANLLYGYEEVPDRAPTDGDRKGIALSTRWTPSDKLGLTVDYYGMKADDNPDLGGYLTGTVPNRRPARNVPVYAQEEDFLSSDVDIVTARLKYQIDPTMRLTNVTRVGNADNGYVGTGARGSSTNASNPGGVFGTTTSTLSPVFGSVVSVTSATVGVAVAVAAATTARLGFAAQAGVDTEYRAVYVNI